MVNIKNQFGKNDCPIIVCSVDNNYSMSLAVMLHSLEANLKIYNKVLVYIIEDELSAYNKNKILESISPNRLIISFVKFKFEFKNKFKISHHINYTTYFRIFLGEIFPTFGKVIYLDCDLIINADISILWNIDCDNYHLFAAQQISEGAMTAGGARGLRAFKELGIPSEEPLFNAGVLLINLALWRQDHIQQQVVAYLTEYKSQVLWWDQDGLNAILYGKWGKLTNNWNVMISIFKYYDTWHESPLSRDQYYEIVTNPYIIHYNSSSKPWHPDYIYPYKEIFYKFLDETSWKGWRP